MNTRKTIVVALGGNAISTPGERGTIPEQFAHTQQTADALCDVVAQGHQLAITHGNGPQVGNILRRVEIASSQLYPLPLEVCVADTQAGMGYMISQCLMNALHRRGIDRDVTTVVTTVLVNEDDPAFENPTKPIGISLSAADAEAHRANDGWNVREIEGGRFRRIVPSPAPRKILELATIRALLQAGQLIVCCGGGGIPVVRGQDGCYRGAPAVIDKDETSALLACKIDADMLIVLTSVDSVYLNYGQADQTAVARMTVDQAREYLAAGQFPSGSMQPKIEAAVSFITDSGKEDAAVVIAQTSQIVDALEGKTGTRITSQ